MLCVAGNGPSTSRLLFLRNALISLICEMGSNFGVLQLIWAVLSRYDEVCCMLAVCSTEWSKYIPVALSDECLKKRDL